MSESFLHYLWQFQYFDKRELCTAQGEPIQIIYTGNQNTHAGPDFQNARLYIGEVEWAGSVEIHIDASAWYEHHHHNDAAYDTVVLHVVWKNDKPVQRKDGSLLPVLELKARVDEQLLLKYKKLINAPEEIPCAPHLHKVSELTFLSMLDKSMSIRLERKATEVAELLNRNHNDWEETCYQLLSRNFGFKVNAEPFLQLAQSLPYTTLMKHADKSENVEALLFGTAGFLDDNAESDLYGTLLIREYKNFRQKYSLGTKQLNRAQWKFLRLRPANFPTIRLAQFANLLQSKKNIFSRILEMENAREMKDFFSVQQSTYWQQHYQLSKPSPDGIAGLGEMSIDNIIINTVVPLLVAYGKLKDNEYLVERAVNILQQVGSEANNITRRWQALTIKSKSAFDSQALIELFTGFCCKRRCLDCNVGVALLKPDSK